MLAMEDVIREVNETIKVLSENIVNLQQHFNSRSMKQEIDSWTKSNHEGRDNLFKLHQSVMVKDRIMGFQGETIH